MTDELADHAVNSGDPGPEIEDLRRALETGDGDLLAKVFERYRERLRRMVRLRLDRRVQARVDPSDVIQDAYLEASTRLADYLKSPDMSFGLWLRFLTEQKLMQVHRRHLDVQARDARLEISLDAQGLPPGLAAQLAECLVDSTTSQGGKQVKAEELGRVLLALEGLDPQDREIIVLRHFEQLSNGEAAMVMGIAPKTASVRYFRAVQKLKKELDAGGHN